MAVAMGQSSVQVACGTGVGLARELEALRRLLKVANDLIEADTGLPPQEDPLDVRDYLKVLSELPPGVGGLSESNRAGAANLLNQLEAELDQPTSNRVLQDLQKKWTFPSAIERRKTQQLPVALMPSSETCLGLQGEKVPKPNGRGNS
jgi:hypothetical protein